MPLLEKWNMFFKISFLIPHVSDYIIEEWPTKFIKMKWEFAYGYSWDEKIMKTRLDGFCWITGSKQYYICDASIL